MNGFKIDLSIGDADVAPVALFRLGLDLGRLDGSPRIEVHPAEELGLGSRHRSFEVVVMFDDPAAAAKALDYFAKLNAIEGRGVLRSGPEVDAEIIPLLPADLSPTDIEGLLAHDNAALQRQFLAEYPSVAVSGPSRRSKGSISQSAIRRWKRDGAIFSILHDDGEHVPAFQFKDSHPDPSIKRILGALPAWFSDWQRAFWFVSTNGWLDDVAPVDRLGDTDAVVAAAQHETEELVG